MHEVYWRFSFRVVTSKYRNDLVKTIREAGFAASIWYPCIATWYTSSEELFPVGEVIERSIINLWVDESCSESTAKSIAQVICNYFNNKE